MTERGFPVGAYPASPLASVPGFTPADHGHCACRPRSTMVLKFDEANDDGTLLQRPIGCLLSVLIRVPHEVVLLMNGSRDNVSDSSRVLSDGTMVTYKEVAEFLVR